MIRELLLEFLVKIEKEIVVLGLLSDMASSHLSDFPMSPANCSYTEQNLGTESKLQDVLV